MNLLFSYLLRCCFFMFFECFFFYLFMCFLLFYRFVFFFSDLSCSSQGRLHVVALAQEPGRSNVRRQSWDAPWIVQALCARATTLRRPWEEEQTNQRKRRRIKEKERRIFGKTKSKISKTTKTIRFLNKSSFS